MSLCPYARGVDIRRTHLWPLPPPYKGVKQTVKFIVEITLRGRRRPMAHLRFFSFRCDRAFTSLFPWCTLHHLLNCSIRDYSEKNDSPEVMVSHTRDPNLQEPVPPHTIQLNRIFCRCSISNEGLTTTKQFHCLLLCVTLNNIHK